MVFVKNKFEAASQATQYDQGLRAFLVQVYRWMGIALGITGVSAFAVSSSPSMMNLIFGTPLKWLIIFAPLVVVYILGSRINTMKAESAYITFMGYSVLMGLSMSSIFMIYTSESIARAFFTSAIVFGGASLYGQVTKRDLSGMGSIMMMGVFGILASSIVNIFMQSSALQFAISVVGVVVFTGLAAYDSKNMKNVYYNASRSGDVDALNKSSIICALHAYINFINIFIFLLDLLGGLKGND